MNDKRFAEQSDHAKSERKHPTVLISYSHDSPDHEARVLELSNLLRGDGIDCEIDLYVPGGAPPQGWMRWMEEHVEKSDFVIMVCTATYSQRVLRKEPAGIGKGVIWEANLLYNLLYSDGAFRQRVIPLLFPGSSLDHVPLPFRDNYCDLEEKNGYERLLQRLLHMPAAVKPQLGPLPPPERFERKSVRWIVSSDAVIQYQSNEKL